MIYECVIVVYKRRRRRVRLRVNYSNRPFAVMLSPCQLGGMFPQKSDSPCMLMDMSNLTQITLAWELYQEGMAKVKIARRLGRHRETIHLWIRGIEEQGLLPFLDRYQRAKKGPRPKRRVDPMVKRWVWAIRERESECCGQKIAYFL